MIDKIWKSKLANFKNKYENCNLIVKSLPKEIGNKELFDLFRPCGEITSAKIATKGVFKEMIVDNKVVDKEFVYESKGYGYVCFRKAEDAVKAIEKMNNKVFVNRGNEYKLNVEFFNYDRLIHDQPQGQGKNTAQNMLNKDKDKFKGGQKKSFPNNRGPNQQQYIKNNMGVMNQMNNMPIQTQNQPQQGFDYRNEIIQSDNSYMYYNNFVKELYPILNKKDDLKRSEILGDKIFFFLFNFLQMNKVNQSSLPIEDLCSRLTGIFINVEQNSLLEIFESESTLINTVNDIINVSILF